MLWRNKFFERKSPMFMREIMLILGGIVYFSTVDYLANELMWNDCKPLVGKYTRYSDSYYMDSKSLEQMK